MSSKVFKFIDRIKTAFDIETLFSNYDIEATHTHSIVCPFHNDTKPSLSFYGENNFWFKCFGCEKRGNAIEFVKLYEHCNLEYAVKKLGNMMGVKVGRIKDDQLPLLAKGFKVYESKVIAEEMSDLLKYTACRQTRVLYKVYRFKGNFGVMDGLIDYIHNSINDMRNPSIRAIRRETLKGMGLIHLMGQSYLNVPERKKL